MINGAAASVDSDVISSDFQHLLNASLEFSLLNSRLFFNQEHLLSPTYLKYSNNALWKLFPQSIIFMVLK